MPLIRNSHNLVRFLLVSAADHATPMPNLEPTIKWLDVTGWTIFEGTPQDDGEGWYHFLMPPLDMRGTVIIMAEAEGTAQWRDIEQVIDRPITRDEIDAIKQGMAIIGQEVSMILDIMLDHPLEQDRLYGHGIIVEPWELTQAALKLRYELFGEYLRIQAHELTQGTLQSTGEPAAAYGPELATATWRVYDATGTGEHSIDADGKLNVAFGAGGTNQQAYQVLEPIEGGIYRVEALIYTEPVEAQGFLRIHRHLTPYDNYTDTIDIVPVQTTDQARGVWEFDQDIDITSSDGAAVRLQFQFGRGDMVRRTVHFDTVSLRKRE